MSENRVKDFTEVVFSFVSLKVKAIILGICIGLFILFICVFALIGVFGNSNLDSDDDEKSTSSSSENIEVSQNVYQYIGAKFSIPFESWNSIKDVVTSKFSPSRTITVNGVTQTKAHTRN